jgi:hypothetical protein
MLAGVYSRLIKYSAKSGRNQDVLPQVDGQRRNSGASIQ